MTNEENKIMGQFLKDMGSGSDLTPENANLLKEIYSTGKSSYRKGDCILSVDLNGQYGNIAVYYVNSVDNKGDQSNLVGSNGGWANINAETVTIYFGRRRKSGEEPYNCQGQLYVPYRWDDLILIQETDNHGVYISESYTTNK